MLVGIHKDSFKGYTPFMQRFESILAYNGIQHRRLDASMPDFWDQTAKLNLFIYWWGHEYNERQIAMSIIPIIEKELNINCLPNMSTCWSFDDKIKQYCLLRLHGFPIIHSWIFWDKKLALKWFTGAPIPIVFKLKGGAGSSNVVLVKNRYLGKMLIRKMFGSGIRSGHIPFGTTRWKDFRIWPSIRHFGGRVIRRFVAGNTTPNWEHHKNYVLFQKFLPNNAYDTRVTVIGNRAFAFRRFNRPKDFRSSGSGLIDYDKNGINLKFVKKAFEISTKMNFQSMAYDFLYDENNEIAFCETSYTYVDTAVFKCEGYWDSFLNWHEGHFWPQYCLLCDALKLYDLCQPELSLLHNPTF